MIKRCIAGCDNDQLSGESRKRLYPFPKDFNLCLLWVQNCGRPDYFEDFAIAGTQPFLHRYVCSDHFSNTDFVKNDPVSGLLPNSTPNINLMFGGLIKEEVIDAEYFEPLQSDSELLNEIKLERLDGETCTEIKADLVFPSTDALNRPRLPIPGTVDVYRETEQNKEPSKEFFKKYKTAMRSGRPSATDQECAQSLRREAFQAKIRRSQASEEQNKLSRMKNAFRRRNETPEQRELRNHKDKLRWQKRRRAETEAERKLRRYNDAVRTAFRRENETEQQRTERLRKDRERASRRRMLERIKKHDKAAPFPGDGSKISETGVALSQPPPLAPITHPPTSTSSGVHRKQLHRTQQNDTQTTISS